MEGGKGKAGIQNSAKERKASCYGRRGKEGARPLRPRGNGLDERRHGSRGKSKDKEKQTAGKGSIGSNTAKIFHQAKRQVGERNFSGHRGVNKLNEIPNRQKSGGSPLVDGRNTKSGGTRAWWPRGKEGRLHACS